MLELPGARTDQSGANHPYLRPGATVTWAGTMIPMWEAEQDERRPQKGHDAVSRAQVLKTPDEAVAGIEDGSIVLVGGFGLAGMPFGLIDALIRMGAKDLTIVSNNAGNGDVGLAALLKAGQVRKVICSFPRQVDSWVFDGLYRAGKVELEVVPQGNLAERMRAAGAGIGAFFCPTAVGTPLAEGKEAREIDGRTYVLEYPIKGDYALIAAYQADTLGNLVYRKTARNFGPVMATAATITIAQVAEVVPVGTLDPEAVVTPSIFVDRIVPVEASRYTVQGAR
jgi:3-oxoadipate CoA-transferase alpha subunit